LVPFLAVDMEALEFFNRARIEDCLIDLLKDQKSNDKIIR